MLISNNIAVNINKESQDVNCQKYSPNIYKKWQVFVLKKTPLVTGQIFKNRYCEFANYNRITEWETGQQNYIPPPHLWSSISGHKNNFTMFLILTIEEVLQLNTSLAVKKIFLPKKHLLENCLTLQVAISFHKISNKHDLFWWTK